MENSTEIAVRGGLLTIATEPGAEPLILKNILDEVAPTGTGMKAEELRDHSFALVRGRAFESRYEGQSHAWWVVGVDQDTGEMFNTVLGGVAVIDVLDAWARAARPEPLIVTLKWNDGGKYNGYYTLE